MRLQHRIGPRARALLLGSALPLLGGCNCTGGVPLNLGLEVRDARTGAPAVYGAVLTVEQAGSVVKTLDSVQLYAPADSARLATFITDLQAGTYDLPITKPGYAAWQRNGIRVRERGIFCPEPEAVTLRAELEPLDGG